MKRAAAIAVALLGLALIAGSCVPMGLVAYRSFGVEPAMAAALQPGAPYRSAATKVATGAHAQVAFRVRVDTPSVQQVDAAGGEKYKARYEFPMSYRVLDSGGKVLADERGTIEWKSSALHVTRDEATTSTGGRLTVEHRFARFEAPPDGWVTVEAQVEPDTRYLARASEATLLLYDGQAMEKWPVATWIAMFTSGMLLAILGFVFAISTLATASQPAAGAAGAVPAQAEARRYAVLCHLSGLLGYLLPFGHVLGAVGAYLAWRHHGEFVADQGREALNFQLSVTVYMAASAVLIVVLVGFLLLLAVAVFHFALMIAAAAAASSGRLFRYPLTIRFIN